jgi:hypothetical protein
MGETNEYKIVVRKSKIKIPVLTGRSRLLAFRIGLGGIYCVGLDWIQLAEDRV